MSDRIPKDWVVNAAKLLRQPDPGPTPFLVEQLIAEESIFTIGGQYKVGKTWLTLEVILAVTGARPAFGRYEASKPGRVLAIFEESGQVAFTRRMRALRKGYGIDHKEFDSAASRLFVAANAGVRFNDPEWQAAIIKAAKPGRFRLILFDPFVRMKSDAADENKQVDIAPALTFLRELRRRSGAAVGFVHHTGYDPSHFRGTTDFEGWWESRLMISGSPSSGGPFTLATDHREAEGTTAVKYRITGKNKEQWVRLEPMTPAPPVEEQRRDQVHEYVEANPGHTSTEIATAMERQRKAVADDLKRLALEGLVFFSGPGSPDYPSGEVKEHGRSRNRKEWFSRSNKPSATSPDAGENTGEHPLFSPSPPLKQRGEDGGAKSKKRKRGGK